MDALQLQKSINWKMQSIEEVLVSLEGMVEPPLVEDFICILQKGGRAKNFANAKQVHAHICNNGLEAHKALGKCLIPMFVECGSILDAQRVFDRLVHTDEYAWTSLIQGYNKFGKFHHALHLFEIMQGDYVRPSAYTYVALLKSCTMSKWLERGQELYAEVVKKGYEANIFVGSSLVDMYAKCGLLVDAQEVHDELPSQNVVSWTALIAGYSDQGLDQEVLSCLKQLQLEDVSLDAITSVYTLKSCRSLGALQEGCEIHAEIVKEGLEKDRFVGSSLVYMYAKLGSFAEAREVLDELQVRDVVSWTSLIAGYSENGHGEEALNCWERMQLEVMTLDAVTYVCGLKACGSIRAIDKGQEIHGMLAKEGFERDPYVGSILVDMYARCGLLMEACDVLNELTVRSVVSWNALLAGYAEHGDGDLVLNCLEQMQLDGVVLDAVSFVCGLKSCGSIEAIERGQELHSEISKEGFDTDPFVGSMLVDMYAKCGLLAEAQEVFDTIPVQDVVLWTTLIAGYAEHGFGEKVLNYWDQMQQEGVIPDALMFVCSLKACGSIGVVERGQEMYSEVVKKGFERDLFIGSTLVDMYTQYGSLLEARKVFDDLLVRDAASWTALIVGYAQHGLVEKLENCFEQMQLEGVFPDVSLWNVVISGYGDQGESEKAHQVFTQMQERGLSPNRVTFLSILKACGHAASIDMGNKIHSQIYRIDEAVGIEVVLATALIDMYGKCGSMVDAQRVFDAMWSRDVLSWNALVLGYSRQGKTDTTFHLFKRMMQEGIQPNDVTILSVLTVCSHVGLVDTGQKCFEAMRGEYSIIPTVQHQNCMIDLLCRAGHLDEAVVVLEKMPYEPDVVTCSTLLSACKKWGSVEIGKHAFEHALRLGEKHSAAFTLMSNIYMDYHMETNEAD